MIMFLTMPLILLSGCATKSPSTCEVDRGLIVDLPGVVRPSQPVTNRKIMTAIRDSNDRAELDNTRKDEIRKQLDACSGD